MCDPPGHLAPGCHALDFENLGHIVDHHDVARRLSLSVMQPRDRPIEAAELIPYRDGKLSPHHFARARRDPTQEVLTAILHKHVKDAVVRLHITIPAELVKRLDERSIRAALADAHFIAPVTREVLRDRRPRLGTAAKGIAPEEALRWYLENRETLDPDARQRALERGIELIQAETAGE